MVLNLSNQNDYNKMHIILHEFGHALGLGHEHQHPEYIRVMEQFLDDGATMLCFKIPTVAVYDDQFKELKYDLAEESKDYDVDSIMHYP